MSTLNLSHLYEGSVNIFIAGVMRGSLLTEAFVDQSYRSSIIEKVNQHFSNAVIIDPNSCNEKESNSLTDQEQEAILFTEIDQATDADILIAYLPTASMGSAIEMYAAYSEGVFIITISPMEHNWVVKHLSDVLFDNLTDFLADGDPFEGWDAKV